MFYFLSVLIGCIVAVMIVINGKLSALCGIFAATVIIHIVGTVFAFVVLKLRKSKLGITRAIPLWLFSGGALGALTTVCNNISFGRINITSMVALCLLGQTLTSLVLDGFGLMGMRRQRFTMPYLAGLALAVVGIGIMLTGMAGAALLAVILSLSSGMWIVLSRTVNAELSNHVGAMQGSFINHAVGLPITVLIFLLLNPNEPLFSSSQFFQNPAIFFGGILGVVVVLLYNLVVPNVSAVSLTLLSFAGQIFTSILLDLLTGQPYSAQVFWGGLLVAGGVLVNLLLKRGENKQKEEVRHDTVAEPKQ